ncbi:hypothetical protein ACJX0J_031055 [Zea mays]
MGKRRFHFESFWPKLDGFMEGDANTAYFQHHARYRKKEKFYCHNLLGSEGQFYKMAWQFIKVDFMAAVNRLSYNILRISLYADDVRRYLLSKRDLLPLVEKVADRLPSWKAALIHSAGRATLVKSLWAGPSI